MPQIFLTLCDATGSPVVFVDGDFIHYYLDTSRTHFLYLNQSYFDVCFRNRKYLMRNCAGFGRRGLASAVSRSDTSSLPSSLSKILQLSVSKNPENISVGSFDKGEPVSSIAFAVRSGSRHETWDERGITQFLRHVAPLSTTNLSQTRLVRGLQQLGATLNVSSSRECIVYRIDCLRPFLAQAAEVLHGIVCEPRFQDHEISEAVFGLQAENGSLTGSAQFRANEAAHLAAFGNKGLGISMLTPSYNATWTVHAGDVYKHNLRQVYHTQDMLNSFRQRMFTPDRAALLGAGVSHQYLERISSNYIPVKLDPHADNKMEPSVFKSGEVRIDTSSGGVVGTVAWKGASRKDGLKAQLCSEVFANALGHSYIGQTPGPQHGTGPTTNGKSATILGKTITATDDKNMKTAELEGFNVSYEDSGLVGFTVMAEGGNADRVLRSAVDSVRSAASTGLTEAQFSAAKSHALHNLLDQLGSSSGLLDQLILEACLRGQTEDRRAMLEGLRREDVNGWLKSMDLASSGGKSVPALGVVGNLDRVPRNSDLV